MLKLTLFAVLTLVLPPILVTAATMQAIGREDQW